MNLEFWNDVVFYVCLICFNNISSFGMESAPITKNKKGSGRTYLV